TLALHHRRFEASHDALTGVLSRGGFDKTLEAAAVDSARYGWAFTLVIIDLDGFHTINRRFGLAHGDAVLRNLGFALRHSIRRGDCAARYGGDEFAVILKNAEGVEAKGFIERVHEHLDHMGLDIKFTYVVVTSPHDSKDPTELVEIASRELEKKKPGDR
ncbi:MAG: GGDEF domain-containing protein, partial [Acidobacteriota bacterium]|nr:GGDEF domain-containing protein [Acidobacteriota bacterium]